MKHRRALPLGVLMFVVGALIGCAQARSVQTPPAQASGKITGTLHQGEDVAPGIPVTVYDPLSGLLRKTVTDAEGVFEVSSLPVAKYRMRIHVEGFWEIDSTFPLNAGETIAFNNLLLMRRPLLSDDGRAAELRATLPYDSITLHHPMGGGVFCCKSTLVLRKDGQATLAVMVGSPYVEILNLPLQSRRPNPGLLSSGVFVGTVNLEEYARLCRLIEQVHFDRLEKSYAIQDMHAGTEIVSVSTPAGVISVLDYGGAAPVELWAVQRAIRAIGLGIEWWPQENARP